MADDVKQFFKNNLLVTIFGLSFFVSLINFGLLFFFVRQLNNLVILHYNVYLGVDLMGDSKQIYLIPLVGFLFAVINLLLAIYFFSKKERMLSHILSLITLILQLGIAVASGALVLVNYL